MADHISFDGWVLLRSTGELTRGTARIRLQGQPLEVLEALLERSGELVTREQLIARLWPAGVVVEFDTALNSAIRRLRTALDDHADHPRYIETIPRRGYRFIGQLDTIEPAVAASPHPAHVERPGSAAAPPAVHGPVGPDLTQRAGVRRRRIWTGWAAAGLIALAAGGIVLALGNRAAPVLTAAGGSTAAGIPAEALERYERARFFFGRRAEGDTARALTLYRETLRLAPAYAPAWAGIASVRWIDTMEGRMTRAQGLPLVREAAERALAHEPTNGEALMRLANYHNATGDAAAGERAAQRAFALAPDAPLVLAIRSERALEAGRVDEAIALSRRAVQQDPLAVALRHNLMVLLFVAGHYDEAQAEFRKLDAISPPSFPPDTLIGQSILLGGDPAGALKFAQTLPAGGVREQLESLSYFALGRRADADAALQRLAALSSKSAAYRVAEVHAYRGEADAAFFWLQRAANADSDDCPTRECWPRAWVARLPLLRTLQADPRWPAIHTALVDEQARPRRS
jgi:DNA-binding winged helix-turn-helix (wHTH) protein/tetratricopeptide (TPR) repeat protein